MDGSKFQQSMFNVQGTKMAQRVVMGCEPSSSRTRTQTQICYANRYRFPDSLYKPPKYEFRDRLCVDDFNSLTEDPDFIKNELEFNQTRFAKRLSNARGSAKQNRLEATLASIYDAFVLELSKKVDENGNEFMRQVITSTINRLETPTISEHELDVEHKELCIVNLQKTIRGRAVQIMMQDEIKKNLPTILELKTLHKADPYGLHTTYGQALAQANLQEDRELQQEKQNEVTEIMDQLEGETLSRMFDFLEKEMVRLLDERKIHALMILAERERRMREATEGGRRQKEEEKRRFNDEVFRHVVGIHQSTADMYLEDLYLEQSYRLADRNAREYIKGLVEQITEAYLPKTAPQTEADEQVALDELSAGLVYSFILPEMNREAHRERVQAAGARYMKAANEIADAVFGAQEIVHDILDVALPTAFANIANIEASSTEPPMEHEHDHRHSQDEEDREEAVDVAQNAVDSVIEEALVKVTEIQPSSPSMDTILDAENADGHEQQHPQERQDSDEPHDPSRGYNDDDDFDDRNFF